MALKKKDYERGVKRVNLALTIPEYENLETVSYSQGFVNPGTYARSIIVKHCGETVRAIKAVDPRQEHLFGGKKRRYGKN